MRGWFRTFIAACLLNVAFCHAADVPKGPLRPATLREIGQPSYYWESKAAGDTAQLLTLFCHSCQAASAETDDLPLVSVLRDTLGDENPENDRLSYVWLLSYARPNLGQRLLSAVPFFYWRVADGSKTVSPGDTAPLFDLTAPAHPVLHEVGRSILQWTALDPMTTPVRATSRAYRNNQQDHERLHLQEAISYLRHAPVSDGLSALTQVQLDTIIARLELRKRLLGGLVNEARAAQLGEESGFEQERIRSRNWELLRQCAEKTGLIFEPLEVAGTSGQYGMLWFPLNQSFKANGTSLRSVWKLLNIRNPWADKRLKEWKGAIYTRALDENGSLLPAGITGPRQLQLVPLGVYSFKYPKLPLLLVDFRDSLHIRRHELTQRSINEITSGILGISHFTNWYYFVAADLYDFIASRHGAAMDQAERLDSYSQFRVSLALDSQLDPDLRKEIQRRVDLLAVNPLEGSLASEMQAARQRYLRLEAEAQPGGKLTERLDKQRRAELAAFGETKKKQYAEDILHDLSLGAYTHRASQDPSNLEALDISRRVAYHLGFLDSLVADGTPPEVAYASPRIQASIDQLNDLMPAIGSRDIRAHAASTLERLRDLSHDAALQEDCSLALTTLRGNPGSDRPTAASGLAVSARSATPLPKMESLK